DDFEVTNAAPDQTVTLADGGSGNVTIGGTYPNFTVDVATLNDADSDPNNEDQTVSAGTGITVNQVGDDFEVTNAAPDQTVTLGDGGSGTITTGGTYPNLTADVAPNGITSNEIADGTITNIDINAGANIDGSKINPVFTSDVTTTGDFIAGGITLSVPDFVFEKYYDDFSSLNNAYRFRSLKEVEAFVREHKHLPGIRSASEVKTSGEYRLTESSLDHLEKIEELFLHTIEQEKKIEKLESEKEELAKELEALKSEIREIKILLLNKNEK
ncbi:hypothetical protein M3P07_17685, partial [Flagellimonas sp. 2012CJ39-3]|nr:hypothetical protein [Muricauda myxillae]